MELSPEQQQAYDRFVNDENVFLTGPGGTGKSMLVRKMYSFCKEMGREVAVCALTGCAGASSLSREDNPFLVGCSAMPRRKTQDNRARGGQQS